MREDQSRSNGRARRRRPARLARWVAAGLMLLATACTGASATPGGEEDVPGEVPDDVSFADPPEDALQARDIDGELTDGTSFSSSELWEDRPVVLLFTASWCQSCAELHQELADLADAYGDAVAMLALVLDEEDPEDVENYAGDVGAGYPIMTASLGEWEHYAADEPPLVVLVANGGKVLRGWPGGVDTDVLAGHIDGLIEEGPTVSEADQGGAEERDDEDSGAATDGE